MRRERARTSARSAAWRGAAGGRSACSACCPRHVIGENGNHVVDGRVGLNLNSDYAARTACPCPSQIRQPRLCRRAEHDPHPGRRVLTAPGRPAVPRIRGGAANRGAEDADQPDVRVDRLRQRRALRAARARRARSAVGARVRSAVALLLRAQQPVVRGGDAPGAGDDRRDDAAQDRRGRPLLPPPRRCASRSTPSTVTSS